ncbi:hypothetical protein VE04_08756, partial [Pseudogymnoascus sp. 24MN13]
MVPISSGTYSFILLVLTFLSPEVLPYHSLPLPSPFLLSTYLYFTNRPFDCGRDILNNRLIASVLYRHNVSILIPLLLQERLGAICSPGRVPSPDRKISWEISSDQCHRNATIAVPTYWDQYNGITHYNGETLNVFERLWAAWYAYMQNDVLATGIMSFVMHE